MTNIVMPYGKKMKVQVLWSEDAVGAKQEFKDECDINFIMKKAQNYGVFTHENRKVPNWGLAPNQTFHDVMVSLAKAKEYFEELPSYLRNEFGNNVETFVDATLNTEQINRLRQLGFDLGTVESNAVGKTDASPETDVKTAE